MFEIAVKGLDDAEQKRVIKNGEALKRLIQEQLQRFI